MLCFMALLIGKYNILYYPKKKLTRMKRLQFLIGFC